MYYCFFPQEDNQQLMTLRSQLNPLLKLIMKMLNFELTRFLPFSDWLADAEEAYFICDEMIREARSLTATSMSNLPQTASSPNTLQLEHHQLKLNLK